MRPFTPPLLGPGHGSRLGRRLTYFCFVPVAHQMRHTIEGSPSLRNQPHEILMQISADLLTPFQVTLMDKFGSRTHSSNVSLICSLVCERGVGVVGVVRLLSGIGSLSDLLLLTHSIPPLVVHVLCSSIEQRKHS